MKAFLSIAAAAALTAVSVQAQNENPAQAQDEKKESVIVEHDVVKFAPAKGGMTFERQVVSIGGAEPVQFVSAEGSIAGKPVKGSPYSAEAINESTQTLADGNRIVSKTSTFTFRDSEGRTRREMTLAMPGMVDSARFVTISDPVAGTSFHLDTNAKIARKMPVAPDGITFGVASAPAARMMRAPFPGVPGDRASFSAAGGGAVVSVEQSPAPIPMVRMRSAGEPKTESLGKRIVEGVEAEGSRSTITIPAGEIGNEREILIVTERWYSPELQTVILSKHSDPRMGETTYTLTNVKRVEPHGSLFQVPSDYVVHSDEGPGVRVFRKMLDHK